MRMWSRTAWNKCFFFSFSFLFSPLALSPSNHQEPLEFFFASEHILTTDRPLSWVLCWASCRSRWRILLYTISSPHWLIHIQAWKLSEVHWIYKVMICFDFFFFFVTVRAELYHWPQFASRDLTQPFKIQALSHRLIYSFVSSNNQLLHIRSSAVSVCFKKWLMIRKDSSGCFSAQTMLPCLAAGKWALNTLQAKFEFW